MAVTLDTDKLLALSEKMAELQKVERAAKLADTPGQASSFKKEANAIQKQINALQRGVLKTYNPNFIRCRDIGHQWDVSESTADDDGLSRVLECSRCGTTRNESFSKVGEMTHRSYVHAEDYLLPVGVSGVTRYTKQFWRGIEWMRESGAK